MAFFHANPVAKLVSLSELFSLLLRLMVLFWYWKRQREKFFIDCIHYTGNKAIKWPLKQHSFSFYPNSEF